MCRAHCLLVMVAWFVGVTHSWDFAVSVGDQLIFYTNDGNKTDTVHFQSRNLAGLAYDEVQNVMLYVDKQDNNDAICGYYISSKENQCFVERNGRNIHSIAYDPVTENIFFTDTNEKSINWISLKRGSNDNIYGNLLIKMQDQTPTNIAVDSCRGYIYWSEGKIMERARLNGSERKVVYQKEYLDVLGFDIDPQTQRNYHTDGFIGNCDKERSCYYYVSYADLDGRNETACEFHWNTLGKEMTVSKDYIYWITSSGSFKSVWQRPKHIHETSKEISKFYTNSTLGIAANYKIADQIKGIDDCSSLSNVTTTNTVAPDKTQRSEVSVCENYCFQGKCSVIDNGLPKCSCNTGYTGTRCEVYACHAYCLFGNCSLSDEGHPTCSCNAGYSGERCEVSACHGYCLNDEYCSLNDEFQPMCW